MPTVTVPTLNNIRKELANSKYYLNIRSGYMAPVTLHCSYGDSGETIDFYLFDGGDELDLTGSAVSVHGTRSDGANFGPFTCSTSGNAVSFNLQSSMTAVEGGGIAEIVISKNETTIGTANFGIMVEDAVFPNGVAYDSDPSVYQDILRYVQSIPAQLTYDYTTKIAQEATERKTAMATQTEKLDQEIVTRQSEVATERTRIDEYLSHGTAATNSELIDIRVKTDGTSLTTAGSAVREQFRAQQREMDYIIGNTSNLIDLGTETTGKYIDLNGVEQTASNFYYVTIPVSPYNTKITYCHVTILAWFKDDTFVSAVAGDGTGAEITVRVPAGANILKASINTNRRLYTRICFGDKLIYFPYKDADSTHFKTTHAFNLWNKNAETFHDNMYVNPSNVPTASNDHCYIAVNVPAYAGKLTTLNVSFLTFVTRDNTLTGAYTPSQLWPAETCTIPSGSIVVYISVKKECIDSAIVVPGNEISESIGTYSKLKPTAFPCITVAKDGTGDFTTVSEAVSHAVDGDTVYIKNGTYDNEVVWAWRKTISIIGEDRAKVIIQNNYATYTKAPLQMASGLLKNVTVRSYGTGDSQDANGAHSYAMHVEANDLMNNTLRVENCSFYSAVGQGGVGMGMRKGCEVSFDNCEFTTDELVPFFVHDAYEAAYAGVQNLTFKDCVFYNPNYEYAIKIATEKHAATTVNLSCIRCTFVDSNATPRAWIMTDSVAPGSGTVIGNLGIVGWNKTRKSYGNNIDALNY